ncbi:VOC family protein [Rhodococcus sp. AB351]|uniref:VOC family protein n=1 Tax=Rhodococcus sp. AB351 TaxID=3413280 RepID=UPI003C270F81
MKIYGLGWVGSRTANFTAMRDFVADKLGLTMTLDQENAVVFAFPDGSAFEVFKPTDDDHSFFEHPVPGLLVDDVREVRAELETKGVEFLGDVHTGVADSWGTAWSHFRAPDGQIYVLISRPQRHPTDTVRAFDELRICLRVDDLDEAVHTYRDGLGLPVVDEWTHPGGQRGILFGVAPAAIELFDGPQWDLVDDSETGQRTGTDHALRVEVRDRTEIESLAKRLESTGVGRTGEIVHTPWDQDCLRMTGGDGRQLTLFTLPQEERAVREEARSRLPY